MAADEQNDDHPFTKVERALADLGCSYRRTKPDQIRATCPSHRDAKPSLSVTRKHDRVLMRCFAGCRYPEIVRALGLRVQDTFTSGATRRGRTEIVALYDYRNLDGNLLAQKVRIDPKAFRWRRPDPSTPSGWRWALDDIEPGLYRWPEIFGRQQVFCAEGEKAVDMLWAKGLPATCPPAGASRWISEWSSDLHSAGCRELVVLSDADRSGCTHAARVAATTYATHRVGAPDVQVKVVTLPGLRVGQDVWDWVREGHTVEELLEITAATPRWSPELSTKLRLDRRRELTRERVRRHRARQRIKLVESEGAA